MAGCNLLRITAADAPRLSLSCSHVEMPAAPTSFMRNGANWPAKRTAYRTAARLDSLLNLNEHRAKLCSLTKIWLPKIILNRLLFPRIGYINTELFSVCHLLILLWFAPKTFSCSDRLSCAFTLKKCDFVKCISLQKAAAFTSTYFPKSCRFLNAAFINIFIGNIHTIISSVAIYGSYICTEVMINQTWLVDRWFFDTSMTIRQLIGKWTSVLRNANDVIRYGWLSSLLLKIEIFIRYC